MARRNGTWTPERRLEHAEVTKLGIQRAREQRQRDDQLSTWAVRNLSRQLERIADSELLDALFTEARERMEAHRTDLGGPGETSAKEDSLLLYEENLWLISQLATYVGIRNLTSGGAAEMFAKGTSAARAGSAILQSLGLARRATKVVSFSDYFATDTTDQSGRQPSDGDS